MLNILTKEGSGGIGASFSEQAKGLGFEHRRSADLQSAVSPNFIRQRARLVLMRQVCGRPADCKSAKLQGETLRYTRSTGTAGNAEHPQFFHRSKQRERRSGGLVGAPGSFLRVLRATVCVNSRQFASSLCRVLGQDRLRRRGRSAFVGLRRDKGMKISPPYQNAAKCA